MKLEAYLNFHGHTREALTFYQSVLGGEIVGIMTFGEIPGGENDPNNPPGWEDKVMHGHLRIGDTSIMGCDYPPHMEEATGGYQVAIQLADTAEAERIWAGLSKDAQIIRLPLAQTFWSPLFGMLTDKFGIPWMINVEQKA